MLIGLERAAIIRYESDGGIAYAKYHTKILYLTLITWITLERFTVFQKTWHRHRRYYFSVGDTLNTLNRLYQNNTEASGAVIFPHANVRAITQPHLQGINCIFPIPLWEIFQINLEKSSGMNTPPGTCLKTSSRVLSSTTYLDFNSKKENAPQGWCVIFLVLLHIFCSLDLHQGVKDQGRGIPSGWFLPQCHTQKPAAY